MNDPETMKRLNKVMRDMNDFIITPDQADKKLSEEWNAYKIDAEAYKKYYRKILKAEQKAKEINV